MKPSRTAVRTDWRLNGWSHTMRAEERERNESDEKEKVGKKKTCNQVNGSSTSEKNWAEQSRDWCCRNVILVHHPIPCPTLISGGRGASPVLPGTMATVLGADADSRVAWRHRKQHTSRRTGWRLWMGGTQCILCAPLASPGGTETLCVRLVKTEWRRTYSSVLVVGGHEVGMLMAMWSRRYTLTRIQAVLVQGTDNSRVWTTLTVRTPLAYPGPPAAQGKQGSYYQLHYMLVPRPLLVLQLLYIKWALTYEYKNILTYTHTYMSLCPLNWLWLNDVSLPTALYVNILSY